MRALVPAVLASACLTCLVASAFAEPTREELDARADALREQLAHDSMTVLVEPPFVVIGDGGERAVTAIARGFLRDKVRMLEKDFFAERPHKLLEVWLFTGERAFRKGAKKYFDDTPDTPFGYYSPEHNALIMNANGLGTLSHELVHPYVEVNFDDAPAWFNEGLASLFEYPGERRGHIIGHVNWRLPNLQKQIRSDSLASLTKLVATSSSEFYDADWDAYAEARYVMYYLQEHDLLHAFFTKFHDAQADDPTGRASLEAVLGEKLDTFEPKWRKFVLALHQ
jgi:uncharacterized protein DUF1570